MQRNNSATNTTQPDWVKGSYQDLFCSLMLEGEGNTNMSASFTCPRTHTQLVVTSDW